ncbi:MAG: homoserine dehydrogenase [Clostridium celatum]|nr:homoserine dehydrogenase [Clostridium celatum]
MNIGLIGFGGVGQALIKLFIDKKDYILEKYHLDIKIKYILKSDGGLYDKKGINLDEVIEFIENNRNIKEHLSWKSDLNIKDIINNNDIDTLIELTSTNIETGEPGLTHIKRALENKMNVVTGNKGPIILKYNELKEIAHKNSVELKVGCTTGGALPSINGGIYDIAGSEIQSIEGILNGTTNYILSKMINDDITYEEALKDAQECGIAEVKLEYLRELKKKNKKLKLIGKVDSLDDEINAYVKLIEIDENHPLYFVDYKNKGIYFKTDTLGDVSIIGGASGTRNAAASILRDIVLIKSL